jgi:hypothetical protein
MGGNNRYRQDFSKTSIPNIFNKLLLIRFLLMLKNNSEMNQLFLQFQNIHLTFILSYLSYPLTNMIMADHGVVDFHTLFVIIA